MSMSILYCGGGASKRISAHDKINVGIVLALDGTRKRNTTHQKHFVGFLSQPLINAWFQYGCTSNANENRKQYSPVMYIASLPSIPVVERQWPVNKNYVGHGGTRRLKGVVFCSMISWFLCSILWSVRPFDQGTTCALF